jgi:hypothetical protein
MVTMNQRLDAETLTIVADEFGYEVEFITVDIEDNVELRRQRRRFVFQSSYCYCNGSRRSR